MKTKHKLALAVLAGVLIGAACAQAIHAQQARKPLGYLVAEVDVHDAATFQKYSQQVPGTLAPFGGRYLVRGGKVQALEGEPPTRSVVIVFDSAEKARAWYDSTAYQAIKPIRLSSSKGRNFIVEGIPPQ